MATTRNELKEKICEVIDEQLPENVELDADSLDDVETAIKKFLDDDVEIDSDDDDDVEGDETPELDTEGSQR